MSYEDYVIATNHNHVGAVLLCSIDKENAVLVSPPCPSSRGSSSHTESDVVLCL